MVTVAVAVAVTIYFVTSEKKTEYLFFPAKKGKMTVSLGCWQTNGRTEKGLKSYFHCESTKQSVKSSVHFNVKCLAKWMDYTHIVELNKFHMGNAFVSPSHKMWLLKKCKLFTAFCSSCCSLPLNTTCALHMMVAKWI